MPTPDISVIIPAYNHEAYIGPAIESVLGQTFGDFELIVINDGSTDRTGAVMRGFSDPRLTCLDQPNQDAFNTLNRGLGLARGRFVAILNSDDLYAPTRLERLRRECLETGAECVFTDVQPVDAAGRPILDPAHGWNVWHQRNRNHYFACNDLYTGFLRGNFLVTTSNLFLTADAARRVGPFAAYRFLHDYDYMFRVLLACPGKVVYLRDERLLFYRIHGGNTLGQGAILAREQDQRVIRTYLLEGVPAEWRGRVATGADRLVELERELEQERRRLAGFPPAGAPVREQIRFLARDLKRKLRARWPALAPWLGPGA
jgi:glycosyltransferase involved in cell wall biosynthesis